MASDTARDIDTVLRYIREEFRLGQDSVSRDDILENGDTIGNTAARILDAVDSGAPGLDPGDILAVRTMAGIWGSGFGLVSRDDMIDDRRSLGDYAQDYPPQTFPAAPAAR